MKLCLLVHMVSSMFTLLGFFSPLLVLTAANRMNYETVTKDADVDPSFSSRVTGHLWQ